MSFLAIGIDFGTTKSVVAINMGGNIHVIPDEEGRRYMPSVVAVTPDQELRIGWDAVNLPPLERWSSRFFTINSIKRSLGHQGETRWGAISASPQEIAALILGRLKLQAELYLGEQISEAVLAIPAYFNINERWALREAAEVAGLNVLSTIHEPTAAALAYGLTHKEEHTVAVFDFGGGTFDISILELGYGVCEVKATKGDTCLGGVDLTKAILNYVCEDFKRREGVDITAQPTAMLRITEAAEQAKCDLSFQSEVSIRIPYVITSPNPMHLDCTISRTLFEELTTPIRQRVATCCREVLKDAGLALSQIDKVVMIGAATRTPSIMDVARDVFQKDPLKSLNPTEAVALGAALLGSIMKGQTKDTLLLDVTPLSMGIATQGGVMTRVIDRNTTIPTKKCQIFTTTEDNQGEVTIRVFQGEKDIAAQNVLVGNITLSGLRPAPRSTVKIQVTLDMHPTGVLYVEAKELGSGNQVQSRLDRPDCCLNNAQMKVLCRKVVAELQCVRNKMDIKQKVLRRSSHVIMQKTSGSLSPYS